MAQHKKVGVVTVGAGLEVVSLEQGTWLTTGNDFTHDHDELRYIQRCEMMVDLSCETWTWRPSPMKRALPMRQYCSFNPHQGVGGAAVHWAIQNWRFYPSDFECRSHHIGRYGEAKLPAGNRIRDWGVTYDELEPYYHHGHWTGHLSREQVRAGLGYTKRLRRGSVPVPAEPWDELDWHGWCTCIPR